ncbi:MAG: hypothetical protein M9947_12280 [Thermomicrobiales bacterium]|nr:hypothetical protein [Thermomicrobiales bacterium]
MALRLAINGLGRVSAQLVRVVNQGGFSDLFDIVAIHDAAGPEAIARALRHDSVYGPFPDEIALDGETLTLGERSIALSSNAEGRNAVWGKEDIPLVIVDGSANSDASALDQHLKKGAKRVILPAASPLADFNLGIGINETSYDPDAHQIVASAAGAPSAIAILYRLLDDVAKIRCGTATVLSPAGGDRSLVDTPASRGGANAFWPVSADRDGIFEQLAGKLSSRLSVVETVTPAAAVGSVSFGNWLEQKTTIDALKELVNSAAESDELIGLIGTVDGVTSSLDMVRDARSVVVDWSDAQLLYDTFLTVRGWYDAEWGAACRLADTLALICEQGVPGTA